MADYYHGGRTMSYSDTDVECYDAGRHGGRHGGGGRTAMYSNTTDECYDSGRHGHGYGGGGRVYSHTDDERYADDGCGGYGARQYSEEYSRGGGGGGEQGYYYKKEEKQHKNREHVGELGALATGAFAMYEGYEAKKDPAHAQKHKIEAGRRRGGAGRRRLRLSRAPRAEGGQLRRRRHGARARQGAAPQPLLQLTN